MVRRPEAVERHRERPLRPDDEVQLGAAHVCLVEVKVVPGGRFEASVPARGAQQRLLAGVEGEGLHVPFRAEAADGGERLFPALRGQGEEALHEHRADLAEERLAAHDGLAPEGTRQPRNLEDGVLRRERDLLRALHGGPRPVLDEEARHLHGDGAGEREHVHQHAEVDGEDAVHLPRAVADLLEFEGLLRPGGEVRVPAGEGQVPGEAAQQVARERRRRLDVGAVALVAVDAPPAGIGDALEGDDAVAQRERARGRDQPAARHQLALVQQQQQVAPFALQPEQAGDERAPPVERLHAVREPGQVLVQAAAQGVERRQQGGVADGEAQVRQLARQRGQPLALRLDRGEQGGDGGGQAVAVGRVVAQGQRLLRRGQRRQARLQQRVADGEEAVGGARLVARRAGQERGQPSRGVEAQMPARPPQPLARAQQPFARESEVLGRHRAPVGVLQPLLQREQLVARVQQA